VAHEPDFAALLYGRLAARAGNLVLSPASLRISLAMVYAGAAGATREEMARVLGLPPGDEAHDEMTAQLDAWGALPRDDGAVPSSPGGHAPRVVNRLWANRGPRFTGAFLARLCDSYGAPLGALDFVRAPATSREAINRWVSEQTANRLKELVPPLLIRPETRLVLTSILHLRAQWATPFDLASTRHDVFFLDGRGLSPGGSGAEGRRQVEVAFMSRVDTLLLARFRGGRLVELPLDAGRLVMDVILPDAPDGFPQIEQQLCDGALATWLGAAARQVVTVSIPRFRIASELGLAGALRLLGMVGAFTWPGADFSQMDGTRELYLAEVLHQVEVEVEVDERRVPAMAAGSVRRARSAVFHADRPFLFAIRDPRTGAILLLGRMLNPT
jgi:serpin B